MLQPSLVSSSTNTLTIQDVVLDSPVWRSNLLHLQDQVDLFEKWVEGFMKALKSYIESIVKHNTQASNLCKKTLLTGLDGTLIDNTIAGNVVTRFATTLQFTIAYKTKMASDLEDTLLVPLQNLVKHDLKTFKETRKQFERTLDRYETQLNRYYVLSKQKEASALREDAFQMFDLRKSYVRSSIDFFSIIVSFKTNLEQLLVSCFADALGAYIQDIDESAAACDHVRTKLNGWKQWMDENKMTSEYQLTKINNRCLELQDAYIHQSRPARSLQRYSTLIQDPMSPTLESEDDHDSLEIVKGEKQGYLNGRIVTSRTRTPWTRRWFFLQQGWFGSCTVSTVQKEKGCIVVGDRIRMADTTCRISDSDRRFCFDLIHPKYTLHLQAETEQEMQQWLWAMEHSQKEIEPESEVSLVPQPLLSPRANLSNKLTKRDSLSIHTPSLVSMSTSPLPSPTLEPSLSTTTSSLTCLMMRESQTMAIEEPSEVMPTANRLSHQLSSWGMPWLSTGINPFSNTDDETTPHHTSLPTPSSSNTTTTNTNTTTITTTTTMNTINTNNLLSESQETSPLVIWPTKLESDAPKSNLPRYSTHLEESQRELRRYFDHVPEEEVVLESFISSFYPSTEGYSGKTYLTQSRIWFYSCTFMTCVHVVVIPLSQIKSVHLENSTLILIETETDKFCFSVWLTSPATLLEKIKYAVDHQTVALDQLYDHLRRIHPPTKRKTRIPTSHVTTTSNTLYTSITPLTVQAHQQPILIKQNLSTSTQNTTDEGEDNQSMANLEDDLSCLGTSFHNSPAQGALAAVAAKSQQAHRKSIQKSSLASPPVVADTFTAEPSSLTTEDWPSDLPKPQTKVSCNCKDHLEKIEADLVLDLSPKALFDLLFSDQGTLWHQLNQVKNNSRPVLSPWQQQERTMQYIMPVSNPLVKVKEADVIETQQILEHQPYLSYVVMVSTKTPQLPYADAFVPCIKYCITYVSPTQSRLVCSMGVDWLKTIFVKGMVNRAAMKGMQETVQGLVSLLQQHMTTLKSSKETIQKDEKTGTSSLSSPTKPTEDKKEPVKKGWSILTLFLCVLCILSTVHQLYIQHKYQALVQENQTVHWRGVYLRDIEEQLTEREMTMTRTNHSVYELFKETRKKDAFQWSSKQHRRMAAEISIMKEKLGVLRFELLSSFRVLNLIEHQLLENEYHNWVADQLIDCKEDDVCKLLKHEID
ncbi:hypothetical protein BD560DRAFT_359388 [Blakeslea trispora]|nr:hypothetical protein BD560DRAFT_359388 [Blakeslea trispora]